MKLSLGEEKVRPSGERCEISKGGPPLPSSSSYFSSYFSYLLLLSNRLAFVARWQNEKWLLIGTLRNFSFEWTYKLRDTRYRESWGGSWGYLQTCSNENNALWGCSKASRASYNVLNLSLIVIAFCL